MHGRKQPAQPGLERAVFGALVELAHQVAAWAEGVVGKGQRGGAEILRVRGMSDGYCNENGDASKET